MTSRARQRRVAWGMEREMQVEMLVEKYVQFLASRWARGTTEG